MSQDMVELFTEAADPLLDSSMDSADTNNQDNKNNMEPEVSDLELMEDEDTDASDRTLVEAAVSSQESLERGESENPNKGKDSPPKNYRPKISPTTNPLPETRTRTKKKKTNQATTKNFTAAKPPNTNQIWKNSLT